MAGYIGSKAVNLSTTGADINGNANIDGDLSFRDNDKIKLGAGSDIQIYHDGTGGNSYIDETGSGSLFIRDNNNIALKKQSDNTNMLVARAGAEVELYHNGSEKLATTSTGCDLTGILTADGLTVDGTTGVNVNGIYANVDLMETDTADQNTRLISSGGDFRIDTLNDAKTVSTKRLTLDHVTGDISFYEDTGTTPKFFWDASAESLGIGTSSPTDKLNITGGGASIEGSVSGFTGGEVLLGNTTANTQSAISTVATGTPQMYFDHRGTSTGQWVWRSSSSERMRIDSSGRVGIGESDPDTSLDVVGGSADSVIGTLTLKNDNTGVSAGTGINFVVDGVNDVTTAAIYGQRTGANYHQGSLQFLTNDSAGGGLTERMRIDSSGRLNLQSSAGTSSILYHGNSLTATSPTTNLSFGTRQNGGLFLFTNDTEAMRIDSSGNVLVGKTSTDINVDGSRIGGFGAVLTRSGNEPLRLNRRTSDGDIIKFDRDGTPVGSIGTKGGDIYHGTGDTGLKYYAPGNAIHPFNTATLANRDNAIDLGMSSIRFDDIYATNGTIQTSDRNEKQDIAELSDAEQRVAVAAKGLLRKFRWKDAVAEKGDEARTHFGIIAQDLQAAFAAEGLDAGDYAMFISSTWTDEETGEERTRMGVRYSELLAFIIGAL